VQPRAIAATETATRTAATVETARIIRTAATAVTDKAIRTAATTVTDKVIRTAATVASRRIVVPPIAETVTATEMRTAKSAGPSTGRKRAAMCAIRATGMTTAATRAMAVAAAITTVAG
jgi:hypothetical protein